MNRRSFLGTSLVPLMYPVARAATAAAPSVDDLRRFTITRITGFRHVARRPHVAGKNARLDVHGDRAEEDVLRITTDAGIEGVGVGSVTPGVARELIGRTLDDFWRPRIGVVSPLNRADHALYDLIGKALATPTWKILGGLGHEFVAVYDGSVYFNDLLPEGDGPSGVARILQEVEQSLKTGHRAFKVKVGRGHRWMPAEEGFQRDVEVVKAVRNLVGKDVKLMADANNGFDLETAKRWIDAVGNELLFVEELFPEQVEQDLMFKDHLRKRGFFALVADGESAQDLDDFDSLIQHEAIDIFQPDVRVWGLTRLCVLARKLSIKPRLTLAPHNWGSFLGLYMQLALGRAVPNFFIAEQDPCASELFDTSGYVLKDGKYHLPDSPGFGIGLREEVFQREYAATAWTVSGDE